MASASTVSELARQTEERRRCPPAFEREVDGANQPPTPEFEAAGENDINGVSAVRRLTQEVEVKRHVISSPSISEQEVENAVQNVADKVRADGHEVTGDMVSVAKWEARLGKDISMQEQIRRVLLREAAVRCALREASKDGLSGVGLVYAGNPLWGKAGEARLAASSATGYEFMFANALLSLNSDKMVYVVSVNSYKRAGVDVIISLSTLGEQFEMTVSREARVEQLVHRLQQDRMQKRPVGLGKILTVTLVGLAGTLLPCGKPITAAFDCEAAKPEPDIEDCVFYPLSVLTSQEWKNLGLVGVTRWKHLSERAFVDLFGRIKDAFGKLPDWKQIPLRKKHGLF